MLSIIALLVIAQFRPSEEIVDPVQREFGPYEPPNLCGERPLLEGMCYVPPGRLHPASPEADLWSRNIMSTVLGRSEEPNLWVGEKEQRTFRCTVLPAAERAVVVRATPTRNGVRISTKILSDDSGNRVGELKTASSSVTNRIKWHDIDRQVGRQVSEEREPPRVRDEHLAYLGATQWFVEARDGDKYYFWPISRPNEDDKGRGVAALCKRLAGLGGDPGARFVADLE